MQKNLPIIEISSSQEALDLLDTLTEVYKTTGVLVLRGHKFTLDEHVTLAKRLGDIFDWNVRSGANQATIDSSIYPGGHSGDVNKEYNQRIDEYLLDWHIEQVYYINPILAGLWNMTLFTAGKNCGNTRFVDSIEILSKYTADEVDFLSKSIVKWDKPTPHGNGPFYTKAIESHPLTGHPTLRVETDQGCPLLPELALLDGKAPTKEEVARMADLLLKLKDMLNNDESIRYTQQWVQGDLLIVDLFRMYHAVMGGFKYGEREFTGIGIRPPVYDNSLYRSLDLL